MTALDNVTGLGSFEFYMGPDRPAWATAGITDTATPIMDIIGYEADRIFPENFANYSSRSPYQKIGDSVFNSPKRSQAVYFKITNAGRVFGAGTISWSFALDQFGRDPDIGPVLPGHTAPQSERLEILTRNILACLSSGTGCG